MIDGDFQSIFRSDQSCCLTIQFDLTGRYIAQRKLNKSLTLDKAFDGISRGNMNNRLAMLSSTVDDFCGVECFANAALFRSRSFCRVIRIGQSVEFSELLM